MICGHHCRFATNALYSVAYAAATIILIVIVVLAQKHPLRINKVTKDMAHAWFQTPLLRSTYASRRLGCDVFLKLENLQYSQSFKFRGISLFAEEAAAKHGSATHLVVASGGNAAYSTCTVAEALKLKCTAYVPEAAKSMAHLLLDTGAQVQIGGQSYLEALKKAKEAVAADPKAVLVPAYDHSLLWRGHSSLIQEVSSQLPPEAKPDAIVCAVGGGGLLGGVITGCRNVGWDDVPIVAMETKGSNCFYQTMLVNRHPNLDLTDANSARGNDMILKHDSESDVQLAHLKELTSLATCLGATSPSAGVVRMALDRPGPVETVCVSDDESIRAALDFLAEHKMLVELACSTALVPAYDARVLQALKVIGNESHNKTPVIVFVVCGGVNNSLEEMEVYNTSARSSSDGYSDSFWVNGNAVQ